MRILHFRHIYPKLLAQNMTGAGRAGCEQLMYESEVMMMEGVSSAQTVADVDTLHWSLLTLSTISQNRLLDTQMSGRFSKRSHYPHPRLYLCYDLWTNVKCNDDYYRQESREFYYQVELWGI